MTAIKKCDCNHEYQDARYGAGMRVHNEAKEKGGSTVWRCTVCGKERS